MKISTKQATTAAALLLAAYLLFTDKGKAQLDKFWAALQPATEGDQTPNYTPQIATPSTPGAPAQQPANSPLNYTLLLKKGSKNNETKELQNWLNQVGIAFTTPLTVDGHFGLKTETRLYNIYKVKETTLQSVLSNTAPTPSTTTTGGNWYDNVPFGWMFQ